MFHPNEVGNCVKLFVAYTLCRNYLAQSDGFSPGYLEADKLVRRFVPISALICMD
jgi:hypothetical protein